MKVILTERVQSLGNVGDIVNVSPGYGRNYLLPRNLAVFADESNKKVLENQQKKLAKKIDEQKSYAKDVSSKLNGHQVDIVRRVSTGGKLFGTVTSTELSKLLNDAGFDVEKRHLVIANPIKALGTFDIKVKFFQGVEAEFKVSVTQDPKQIEEIKKREEEMKKAKVLEEKEAKEASEAKAEESAEGEGEAKAATPAEKTEDQRLSEEAAKILKGY
ncbi:MAG: 50S ribosomal protein L9 [Bacteriovoracaceae bacterium]